MHMHCLSIFWSHHKHMQVLSSQCFQCMIWLYQLFFFFFFFSQIIWQYYQAHHVSSADGTAGLEVAS